MGLSICNGGNGLPVLAEPVYNYFAHGKCTDIALPNSNVPDGTLQFVLERVIT